MPNPISSLVFMCRNVDKTKNGDVGRAPVAVAQGINVFTEVARYNKAFAKGADAAVSVFEDLAKESKIVDGVVKGVKWGTKNVNPMICASGVLKVAMSDDKVDTAIKEVTALSTMLAGEKIAKIGLEKLIPSNSKWGLIAKGLLFVCASIASYSAGEFMGKGLSKEVKANYCFAPAKINQLA